MLGAALRAAKNPGRFRTVPRVAAEAAVDAARAVLAVAKEAADVVAILGAQNALADAEEQQCALARHEADKEAADAAVDAAKEALVAAETENNTEAIAAALTVLEDAEAKRKELFGDDGEEDGFDADDDSCEPTECPKCGKTAADFKSGVASALRSHIKQCDPVTVCHNCGKTAADFRTGSRGLRCHTTQCTAVRAAQGMVVPAEVTCEGCGQVCASVSSLGQHKRSCPGQWVLALAALAPEGKDAAVADLSAEEKSEALAAIDRAVELAALSLEERAKALEALAEDLADSDVEPNPDKPGIHRRADTRAEPNPMLTLTVDQLRDKCKELGLPHRGVRGVLRNRLQRHRLRLQLAHNIQLGKKKKTFEDFWTYTEEGLPTPGELSLCVCLYVNLKLIFESVKRTKD